MVTCVLTQTRPNVFQGTAAFYLALCSPCFLCCCGLRGVDLFVLDADRTTLHLLLHNHWDWTRTTADQFRGRQLPCRHLEIWRWESLLHRFLLRVPMACHGLIVH